MLFVIFLRHENRRGNGEIVIVCSRTLLLKRLQRTINNFGTEQKQNGIPSIVEKPAGQRGVRLGRFPSVWTGKIPHTLPSAPFAAVNEPQLRSPVQPTGPPNGTKLNPPLGRSITTDKTVDHKNSAKKPP